MVPHGPVNLEFQNEKRKQNLLSAVMLEPAQVFKISPRETSN